MSRTRKLTVVLLVLLVFVEIGVPRVKSAPIEREKSNPGAVRCPDPYTHWDPSSSTCVRCTEQCLAGEELKEDCGYSQEGYPVEDPCRQCPNGTYSEGTYLTGAGQNHGQCQDCNTCPSGYQQECNPKQPAVCLCDDDQELAPDGTTCQKICCLCRYDPSKEDVIDECLYRYPRTQYHCKKDSLSAGDTCTRPPQPRTTPAPPSVSTAAPPLTTDKTNTTNKTDVPPLGPTQAATSEPPPTAQTSSEPPSSTAKGMSTVNPIPVPKPGKHQTWVVGIVYKVFGIIAGIAVIFIFIYCVRRHYESQKAKTTGEDQVELLQDGAAVGGGEKEDTGTEDEEEEAGGHVITDAVTVDDPDKEVDTPGGGDSGNESNSKDTSDAGSDKRDGTPEAEGTKENGEADNSDGVTLPKEVASEDTMEFSERIDGPPNDEKGRNAVPFGVGPNRPNQQQPGGGQPPQPPPYPGHQRPDGQPAVNISGGIFNGPVTFVVQGNNSQYHAASGMNGQGQGDGNAGGGDGNPANGAAPPQADGRRQQPAQQDRQRGGDRTGPNSAVRPRNQQAATVTQPPANGNDRVGNRRRQDIQVNIQPNRARQGQDVSFSCVLPDNLDPTTCEFRWRKRDQVDCMAQEQNFNRTVQRCDAGVYTCEVTTPGGDVLEGQAELVIIEDNAEGGVDVPGRGRRPRDNDDDHPTRKRLRTTGSTASGAQGTSNPTAGPFTSDAQEGSNTSGQIQVPDFIQHMPLEKILDNEDLLSKMKVKLERFDRHYRNIGSYYGLKHDEVDHIEFIELSSKDSPFKAILEKVMSENITSENKTSKKKMTKNKTVGELLQYCNETLKRRDVVCTVVDYFVEKKKENQDSDMEVKEDVTRVMADSQSQQLEECSKGDI
ncbi:Hypp3704 [Branchiostoma lanceolatum]|uniref:Hypp3704 protein n=1 Tax=Branchiostoma lanceolatum TaxID=7740 RepID=A0A8K0EXU7_BRALA|nr:Hypp3704 [Branchiostoma lanceolatum]